MLRKRRVKSLTSLAARPTIASNAGATAVRLCGLDTMISRLKRTYRIWQRQVYAKVRQREIAFRFIVSPAKYLLVDVAEAHWHTRHCTCLASP